MIKLTRMIWLLFTFTCLLSTPALAKKNNKDKFADEYSGRHDQKNIRMAVSSKAFSWLSGSPADNEKLSVGKSAQFFGFVALRYQSERIAKRGSLGRAFHNLASQVQREQVFKATDQESKVMQNWWLVRNKILRQLEHHLYSGEEINETELFALGAEFGWLNAKIGLIEAQACASVESTLTDKQWLQLQQFRANPALASQQKLPKTSFPKAKDNQNFGAHYEDIFAKCFSYLTGTLQDRDVIPLGQPAQFFGFVSIRHKSGRGAKRGLISKQFDKLLSPPQELFLQQATQALLPEVTNFKATRRELMLLMDHIRSGSTQPFNQQNYKQVAEKLGVLEIRCAIIEALSYRKIRASMTDHQTKEMMAVRAEYVIDTKTTDTLTGIERGKQIYQLCAGCHQQNNSVAPSLNGVVNRRIASDKFNYSDALQQKQGEVWSVENLDQFLTSPDKAIPGNKMGFAGLLNPDDRHAVISYLSYLK